MSENPYEAPETQTAAIGVIGGSREHLRSVAKLQKGVITCILVYLIAVPGQFALPQELGLLVGIAVLAVGVAAAVFVFLLAIKIYGTGPGVALGVLSLLPLIGLLVLLVVNGKATSVLRQNGIKVGFLGANPAAI